MYRLKGNLANVYQNETYAYSKSRQFYLHESLLRILASLCKVKRTTIFTEVLSVQDYHIQRVVCFQKLS